MQDESKIRQSSYTEGLIHPSCQAVNEGRRQKRSPGALPDCPRTWPGPEAQACCEPSSRQAVSSSGGHPPPPAPSLSQASAVSLRAAQAELSRRGGGVERGCAPRMWLELGRAREKKTRECSCREHSFIVPFVLTSRSGGFAARSCCILAHAQAITFGALLVPWGAAVLPEPACSAGPVRPAVPLHQGDNALRRQRVVGSYKPVFS